MSSTGRHDIDDATLERFLDGELREAQAHAVEAALERDPALRARADEMLGVRALVGEHLLRQADEVDLSGLSERVLARVDETPPLPWTERLGAWLGEVFTYRKPILVPSMAVAAAALLTFTLPGIIDRGPQGVGADPVANAGVEVRLLETGTELAMVYQLPATNTTVIWISDHSDSTEE